jgi:hypothetical protein
LDEDDLAYEKEQNAKKRKAALAEENPDVELDELGDTIESCLEHRWFEVDNGDGIENLKADGTRGEEQLGAGPPGGALAPSVFFTLNTLCMAFLYRRTGRLTYQNGGWFLARAGEEASAEQGGHLKFLVKWKGWSHFHNTWGSGQYLSSFNGYKKVQQYLKKWDEHVETYETWPEEEQEAYDLEQQVSLEQFSAVQSGLEQLGC